MTRRQYCPPTAALFVLLAMIIFKSALLGDDAYIGFRSIHGEVAEHRTHTAVIPAKFAAASSLLAIELRIPHAVAPASLGRNNDHRRLGLNCSEASISELADPK